jgi:ribosomal protein L37AE/L43A
MPLVSVIVLLIVVAALIILPIYLFINWLNRPQRILSFFYLTEYEQNQYMDLHNKIDTQIGTRFAKKLPLTVGMAILTGGTSLLFAGARQAYAFSKQGNAINRVKVYAEEQRIRYGCKLINWNTFPAAHIVIGGEPLKNNNQQERCPICKKITMQHFSGGTQREIYICNSCGKTMAVKRSSTGVPEELLIPGLCVAAIPLAGELHDVVIDLGSSLIDGAGLLLDLLG